MARDSRIALSFVFGLVGGVLILTTMIIFLPLFFGPYGYYGPSLFGPYGFFLGIVSGILVIVSAALSFRRPEHAVTWGIVEVVFGSLSIFGLGGFLVGMALSIAGGALAIVAGSAGGVGPLGAALRACTNCGMLIPMEFAHCPHCGHATAPVAR